MSDPLLLIKEILDLGQDGPYGDWQAEAAEVEAIYASDLSMPRHEDPSVDFRTFDDFEPVDYEPYKPPPCGSYRIRLTWTKDGRRVAGSFPMFCHRWRDQECPECWRHKNQEHYAILSRHAPLYMAMVDDTDRARRKISKLTDGKRSIFPQNGGKMIVFTTVPVNEDYDPVESVSDAIEHALADVPPKRNIWHSPKMKVQIAHITAPKKKPEELEGDEYDYVSTYTFDIMPHRDGEPGEKEQIRGMVLRDIHDSVQNFERFWEPTWEWNARNLNACIQRQMHAIDKMVHDSLGLSIRLYQHKTRVKVNISAIRRNHFQFLLE